MAKAAENSKTGRPIPHKLLADYTKQEALKDAQLQKVRLRHLMLKAQLAKIEHRVKQKVRGYNELLITSGFGDGGIVVVLESRCNNWSSRR